MPSTVFINSKAKRPKNSWRIQVRKVSDTYQWDLIYSNTKGETGPFSSSPQNLSVKIPWGPPVSSEWSQRKVENDMKYEFKFKNARSEIGWFDKTIMNNLDSAVGINPFDQRVTKLCIEGKEFLLSMYLTLLQHSSGFIFNSPSYDENGFLSPTQTQVTGPIKEVDLVTNGGCLSDLEEFIDLAKANAIVINEMQSIHTHNMKRNLADSDNDKVLKRPKLSNASIINNNEKNEMQDPKGLEKEIQDSYVGVLWIPIENITVPKDLIKINPYKVQTIVNSVRSKYDPTLSSITVCPVDTTEEFDIDSAGERKFYVIQKVHLFLAFKEMDETGDFKNLIGHNNRLILACVIDTNSPSMILFSNLRNNETTSQFAEQVCPQQLLFVFNALQRNDPDSNNISTVERMAKHCRVGPNEIYSIVKLCKWSSEGFAMLIKCIEKFEVYELKDVLYSNRLANLISRGKKLKMPNSLLNKLAKCDEAFFVENCTKVLAGEFSFRQLVEDNVLVQEVRKVSNVLSQIAGYKGIDKLNDLYPTKFGVDTLKNFIGADIKNGKMNQKSLELENYFNQVVKAQPGQAVSSLIELLSVADINSSEIQKVGDEYDAVVLLMNVARQELVMSVMKSILVSDKEHHMALFIFPQESLQSEAIQFMRTQKIALVTKMNVNPILFEVDKPSVKDGWINNILFSVMFGKFEKPSTPLKVLYNGLKHVTDIVNIVVPEGLRIAFVSDKNLPVIQIHDKNLRHSVTYFASEAQIKKFNTTLSKDKTLYCNQEGGDIDDDGCSNEPIPARSESTLVLPISDESTTSPVKSSVDTSTNDVAERLVKNIDDSFMNDSGVNMDVSQDLPQMTSTQNDCYEFNKDKEDIESGVTV